MSKMDTRNKEWNIKVVFITFYKFSVTDTLQSYTGTYSGPHNYSGATPPNSNVVIDAVYQDIPAENETLTVCDDTNTTPYTPYFSEWNGSSVQSEQIYPSSMLTNMTGRKLYSISFYSTNNDAVDVKGMQVYLAEVQNTQLTNKMDIPANAVKVYDSDYNFGGGKNLIQFYRPYTYNGGNLLVIIKNSTPGENAPSNKNFYCQMQDENTAYCSYNDAGCGVSCLAKCTFDYEKKYTVTWLNGDGEVIETDKNLDYGTMPEYNGSTPTKSSTPQYTYTFTGWDKDLTAVEGDVTYTAQFTGTVRAYTVTWANEDGNAIKTDTVAYGTIPVYDGETLTKAATECYTYTFSGWGEVTAVTGDVTYTAVLAKNLAVGTVFRSGDIVNFGDYHINTDKSLSLEGVDESF